MKSPIAIFARKGDLLLVDPALTSTSCKRFVIWSKSWLFFRFRFSRFFLWALTVEELLFRSRIKYVLSFGEHHWSIGLVVDAWIIEAFFNFDFGIRWRIKVLWFMIWDIRLDDVGWRVGELIISGDERIIVHWPIHFCVLEALSKIPTSNKIVHAAMEILNFFGILGRTNVL